MGSRQPWQLGPACRLTRLAISCSHRTPAAILVVVKPQRGRGCCDVVADSAARLRRAGIARGEPDDPGTLGLTVASGVDMPRLAIVARFGEPLPSALGFRELAVVRFLDERFIDRADVSMSS